MIFLKLKLDNSVSEKVLEFLASLPKKSVEIEEIHDKSQLEELKKAIELGTCSEEEYISAEEVFASLRKSYKLPRSLPLTP